MNLLLGILVVLVLLVLGILIYLLAKVNGNQNNREMLEYLKTTNVRLDRQGINFNERLDHATTVISQLQRGVGEMSEIGRSMRDLQAFLQSPKLRGNIGEEVLKEMLGQFLPKASFNLQYAFKNGEKVDAAITTTGGIIPIDSKFPMENFRKMMSGDNGVKATFERDVRKHIDDISRKYILPEEGTIDYALMYVPSEAVYYEIVNNHDIFEYAGNKRVLPVSPTTFYAYLKAILMSFEGQKIQEEAKSILNALRAVHKDYEKLEENMGVLQKHLNNAYNMMSNVYTSLAQLGQKLTNVKSLEK